MYNSKTNTEPKYWRFFFNWFVKKIVPVFPFSKEPNFSGSIEKFSGEWLPWKGSEDTFQKPSVLDVDAQFVEKPYSICSPFLVGMLIHTTHRFWWTCTRLSHLYPNGYPEHNPLYTKASNGPLSQNHPTPAKCNSPNGQKVFLKLEFVGG